MSNNEERDPDQTNSGSTNFIMTFIRAIVRFYNASSVFARKVVIFAEAASPVVNYVKGFFLGQNAAQQQQVRNGPQPGDQPPVDSQHQQQQVPNGLQHGDQPPVESQHQHPAEDAGVDGPNQTD